LFSESAKKVKALLVAHFAVVGAFDGHWTFVCLSSYSHVLVTSFPQTSTVLLQISRYAFKRTNVTEI